MSDNNSKGISSNASQVQSTFEWPQPEDNLCAELADKEVFYGDRANLPAYDEALASYQRLCATQPTNPAEYRAWQAQADAYKKQLQDLNPPYRAEQEEFKTAVAIAHDALPEKVADGMFIFAEGLRITGRGMKDSMERAGEYQVKNPHVAYGAARHFAAQQGEGAVTAFTNFWASYETVKQANKETMPLAEYYQQTAQGALGVAAPFLVAEGIRGGVTSLSNVAKGGGSAPVLVTPNGATFAGDAATAVASGESAGFGALASLMSAVDDGAGAANPAPAETGWQKMIREVREKNRTARLADDLEVVVGDSKSWAPGKAFPDYQPDAVRVAMKAEGIEYVRFNDLGEPVSYAPENLNPYHAVGDAIRGDALKAKLDGLAARVRELRKPDVDLVALERQIDEARAQARAAAQVPIEPPVFEPKQPYEWPKPAESAPQRISMGWSAEVERIAGEGKTFSLADDVELVVDRHDGGVVPGVAHGDYQSPLVRAAMEAEGCDGIQFNEAGKPIRYMPKSDGKGLRIFYGEEAAAKFSSLIDRIRAMREAEGSTATPAWDQPTQPMAPIDPE